MTVPSKRPRRHEVGVAFDRWVVEKRGAYWFVIDARTLGLTAGPFNDRDRAQREADRWNVTFREARRG
jgi:hypothetical protein